MLDILFKNLADPAIKAGLRAVGLDTPKKAEDALMKGFSPEQILAIKSAQLRAKELENEDRNNAREMQMVTKDRIVPFLGILSVVMMLPLVGMLFFFEMPSGNKDTLILIIGHLTGWAGAVFTFYFGSSNEKGK